MVGNKVIIIINLFCKFSEVLILFFKCVNYILFEEFIEINNNKGEFSYFIDDR